MQREKTREAIKKGQTGVEADKAEEESATTVISGFVTVVFVWLVVVCGGTWLSGYGGSVIGAASPTGSVRKMPPVRSPGAGAGAAVDVAPPSSSSAARTNDSGGDEGAVEQEADDSGPSTFTASELMQREVRSRIRALRMLTAEPKTLPLTIPFLPLPPCSSRSSPTSTPW